MDDFDVNATVWDTTKAWFDALARGDGQAALNILDENVVWVNTSPEQGLSDIIPWLGEYHGRDAVAETFVIWAELSEVKDFEVRRLFVDGDEAVAVVHEVALVKPTGLHYDIEFIQRLGIENGRIVRWTSYWDTAKGIVAFRSDMPRRLIDAIHSGDVGTVEMLLNAGVSPNTLDPQSRLDALMLAAGLGDERIVALLLEHGANPNSTDPVAGAAPLHKACQRGSLGAVRQLVKAGAFIDLQTATTGHTALMEAAWYKWPEIVSYLLDADAGLNHVTHYGFSLKDHLDYAWRVNEKDRETIEAIRQLVLDRRDADQREVQTQQLMAAVVAGDLAAAKAQLEVGAQVDARAPVLDGFNDRHTPLLVAARDGHAEIVRLLLEHGADVNAFEDTFGAVPLHKATYNGHQEITRILAAQPGVDLDWQGASNGYTPLHDALWHGFEGCARVLVEAGARLDIRGHDGKLPLEIAREVFGESHELLTILQPRQDLPVGRTDLTPWPARLRTGARAIAEQLRVAGLVGAPDSLIIGNPGSGEEWLYLEFTNEIRMGLAEPAVGSIVDGASRIYNKPAVAIAHGFVGFSGMQGDVFNAAQRQSPMLVIVGTSDSQAHTGETHMYADVEGAARAARAKFVKNATDPETLVRDLRDAIVQALVPPYGPVVFIVGSNIARARNTEAIVVPSVPNTRLAPPLSEIERLADGLLAASRPSILIGDAVARSGAVEELARVAELLGADVWASMESEVNCPRNHPLFRGNLGHMDDARGRELLRDTDFALAVGTPIYQTVFNSKQPLFRRGVPVATINHDNETSLRGHNDVTLPLKGDPKRVLGLLADALAGKRSTDQAAAARARIESMGEAKQSELAARRQAQLAEPGVTMAKFGHLLEQRMQALPERPVIFNEALVGAVGLTDHIENANIPGKYFDTSGGSLGEWAGSVGAAMVAGRTIAFIGDGGFHYAPQALWNSAQQRLLLGLVVANNAGYGLLYANMDAALIDQHIDRATIPNPHYYELPAIDYVSVAQGYGVPGMRVDREGQVAEAIDRMLAADGPFLIDLVLKRE